MRLSTQFLGLLFLWGASAATRSRENPFEKLVRRESSTAGSNLQVDLGYEIYAGVANNATKINSFKGQVIRSWSNLFKIKTDDI